MPINNNLPKIIHKSHNLLKTSHKEPRFDCLEALLDVHLLEGSYIPWDQLRKYIPDFVDATWGIVEHTKEEEEDILIRMFKGEHLPGSMKTFQFTFRVDYMTYIGVSHWLRHQDITFSAVCTGDRPLDLDDVMVPESIMNSPKIMEKFEKACKLMYEAYDEAVDSKKISTMDARYLLPKTTEQHYYMSMDWLTLVKVIKQRIDRAIQPVEDNIIAMKMWNEILRVYPKLKDLHIIDVDQENKFYQANARKERSTNLYLPEPQDDKFEYRLDDFVYQCKREDLIGTDPDPRDEGHHWFQMLLNKCRNLWK